MHSGVGCAPGSRRAIPRDCAGGHTSAQAQPQAEPADDGGRHCGRPEGAHSAQGATASGRVISTIWRVVLFEREDLPCGAMDPAPPSSIPPKVLELVGCLSVLLELQA